ncbi:MAG: MBL fold metallo-hydrolase, partial [Alphaproteobacteria bacterium]|nr:MBL fold metallo-hydrolase [Alphaproteobacteria bacterium]
MGELVFDRNFEAIAGRVEQVSPLVRRLLCGNSGPFTFTGTSSFIVGRGTVAIIDPGPDDDAHFEALVAAIRGETVSHIIITHSHADHSPLAARLKAATGAPILGHGPAMKTGAGETRLDAGIDHDFAPDRPIGHGEVIAGRGWTLETVFTPGHMPNHCCFALAEEQILFSGDHVMAWSTSVIAPPDGNMGDYMASLRLLLDRKENTYLPAHGPARRDPLPYVRDLLAHR